MSDGVGSISNWESEHAHQDEQADTRKKCSTRIRPSSWPQRNKHVLRLKWGREARQEGEEVSRVDSLQLHQFIRDNEGHNNNKRRKIKQQPNGQTRPLSVHHSRLAGNNANEASSAISLSSSLPFNSLLLISANRFHIFNYDCPHCHPLLMETFEIE